MADSTSNSHRQSIIFLLNIVLCCRFENDELERLFRRYILRLQQGTITAVVALFVVLTAALATTSFLTIQVTVQYNTGDSTVQYSTAYSQYSIVHFYISAVYQAPTVRNLYHSAHCAIFVVVFIVLCTRAMEDAWLSYVCYGILAFCTSFSVLALPGQADFKVLNSRLLLVL